MEAFFSPGAFTALLQVILIDLTLAGDNAVVIGLAAAGLPPEQRNKAVVVGIVAATLMRIAFASLAVQLLQIVGLLLAGGILLLWVCWKMWRELRHAAVDGLNAQETPTSRDLNADGSIGRQPQPRKTLRQATVQIIVADLSMSLDNVLAVAGAAREHPAVLIFGLGLSIALMGVAATLIARLLGRHRWIAYLGLLIILYVAVEMIWRGAAETWPVVNGAL
jgi:YjbE family integral membrane protein